MGLDFSMSVIHDYMSEAFKECKEKCGLWVILLNCFVTWAFFFSRKTTKCFLMDDCGFIVMHPDWLKLSDNSKAYSVHISQQEPGIAQRLVEKNILIKSSCINAMDLTQQQTWLVQTSILHFDKPLLIYLFQGFNGQGAYHAS